MVDYQWLGISLGIVLVLAGIVAVIGGVASQREAEAATNWREWRRIARSLSWRERWRVSRSNRKGRALTDPALARHAVYRAQYALELEEWQYRRGGMPLKTRVPMIVILASLTIATPLFLDLGSDILQIALSGCFFAQTLFYAFFPLLVAKLPRRNRERLRQSIEANYRVTNS